MGLTMDATGIKAIDNGLIIKKKSEKDKVIALAGNPNVGKSTVFNQLTGLNQHTGNWPGKTVTNAQGSYSFRGNNYILVDIPGTYSLMAHSAEEEVARDFICFGDADAVVVVCDATCLERNLNLVLQTIEITKNVIVCVNLMDEAKKKHINIDFKKLSEILGVKVVGTNATEGKGLLSLTEQIESINNNNCETVSIQYSHQIENAIKIVEKSISRKINNKINTRWLSLKLIDYDEALMQALNKYLGFCLIDEPEVLEALNNAREYLKKCGIEKEQLKDSIVYSIVKKAESICKECVSFQKDNYNSMDRKIDKILTSKATGIPVMIILLAIIFWLTITGSNYPSELLSNFLFKIQDELLVFFNYINAPKWLGDILVLGMYRVLAWVVSVMLPPMAIFFPLFTLLEDLGYLPRVAFNLDNYFKKCNACGKQALTMCMGFGCNAAGVVGCRIIDSPRERLIAIITNNFVPCNGRFPILIAIITMFFVSGVSDWRQNVISVALLTFIIVLGVLMTFLVSKLLSNTILKGVPSSFTLELPPYRKPQISKIIVRSIFDRTLFVLGRAATVAAPAGLVIWIMANVMIGDMSILSVCANFLDPFAKVIGLDGVILMAFIIGFPANEIVMPIIIMSYLCTGTILEMDSIDGLKELLVNNGWTWKTAVSVMLFSLMHWPCSTTCLTIKKETESIKWTAISFIVPTVIGVGVCFLFNSVVSLFV